MSEGKTRWFHAAILSCAAVLTTGANCSAAPEDAVRRRIQKDHTSFPITESPFGLHVISKNLDGPTELGAKWTRNLVLWKWVEPKQGDFKEVAKLSSRINQLSEAGFQILPRIVSVNPWAAQERINKLNEQAARENKPMGNWTYIGVPKDMNAYKAFLTKIVESFDGDGHKDAPGLKHGIKYWQVENEWDWRWKDEPEQFIEFLKIAYETIKKAVPEAKVVLGGISKVAPDAFYNGYLGESFNFKGKSVTPQALSSRPFFAEEYPLRRYVLEKGHPYFDIISFHQYGRYHTIDESAEYLRDIMHDNGYEKPLWITEAGGPFTAYGEKYTDKRHAGEVVKYYVAAMASGVDVIYWSTYLPTPEWGQSFANTSLLDGKKRKKPAFEAYKVLNQQIHDATQVERMLNLQHAQIVRFTRPERGNLWVMWSDAKLGKRKSAFQRLEDVIGPKLEGKTLQVTTCDGSTSTVNGDLHPLVKLMATGPIYVEAQ